MVRISEWGIEKKLAGLECSDQGREHYRWGWEGRQVPNDEGLCWPSLLSDIGILEYFLVE